MTIIGIGNVLQRDDGLGVYAALYLRYNFTFKPSIDIVEGGVMGIHLYNTLESSDQIVMLDAIDLNDIPGSIYKLPAKELSAMGINSGGAHEIGLLQCLDMLEMQGKRVPKTTLIAMVPHMIGFGWGLSETLYERFDSYIKVVLDLLQKSGFMAHPKHKQTSLEQIIARLQHPTSTLDP